MGDNGTLHTKEEPPWIDHLPELLAPWKAHTVSKSWELASVCNGTTVPGALSRLEPPHYSGSDGTPALRRVSRLPMPRRERAVVLYLNKY